MMTTTKLKEMIIKTIDAQTVVLDSVCLFVLSNLLHKWTPKVRFGFKKNHMKAALSI